MKRGDGPRRTQILARDFFDDCALDVSGSPSFAGTTAEGRCLLELSKAAELCNPVAKSEVEAPRVTSAVIDGSTPATDKSLLCFKAKVARKVGSGGAGLLAGLVEGATIDPAQTRTGTGDPVVVAPGNQFPNPVALKAYKLATVCLSSQVLSVVPE